jgi:hypothetical protein
MNIWATVRSLPRDCRDALEAKLGGKDFAVVAVNADKGRRRRRPSAKIGATHLPLHRSHGQAVCDIEAVGMPTTLIVDRQGREIARLVGPADWASPEALAVIEAAIAAPPASLLGADGPQQYR